jgi:murein DD-endopeptidase MepM/ murein hydrolase activator NlpD
METARFSESSTPVIAAASPDVPVVDESVVQGLSPNLVRRSRPRISVRRITAVAVAVTVGSGLLLLTQIPLRLPDVSEHLVNSPRREEPVRETEAAAPQMPLPAAPALSEPPVVSEPDTAQPVVEKAAESPKDLKVEIEQEVSGQKVNLWKWILGFLGVGAAALAGWVLRISGRSRPDNVVEAAVATTPAASAVQEGPDVSDLRPVDGPVRRFDVGEVELLRPSDESPIESPIRPGLDATLLDLSGLVVDDEPLRRQSAAETDVSGLLAAEEALERRGMPAIDLEALRPEPPTITRVAEQAVDIEGLRPVQDRLTHLQGEEGLDVEHLRPRSGRPERASVVEIDVERLLAGVLSGQPRQRRSGEANADDLLERLLAEITSEQPRRDNRREAPSVELPQVSAETSRGQSGRSTQDEVAALLAQTLAQLTQTLSRPVKEVEVDDLLAPILTATATAVPVRPVVQEPVAAVPAGSAESPGAPQPFVPSPSATPRQLRQHFLIDRSRALLRRAALSTVALLGVFFAAFGRLWVFLSQITLFASALQKEAQERPQASARPFDPQIDASVEAMLLPVRASLEDTQAEEPRQQKPDDEIPLPPIPPEPKIERAAPVTAGEIEALLSRALPTDRSLPSASSARNIQPEIMFPIDTAGPALVVSQTRSSGAADFDDSVSNEVAALLAEVLAGSTATVSRSIEQVSVDDLLAPILAASNVAVSSRPVVHHQQMPAGPAVELPSTMQPLSTSPVVSREQRRQRFVFDRSRELLRRAALATVAFFGIISVALNRLWTLLSQITFFASALQKEAQKRPQAPARPFDPQINAAVEALLLPVRASLEDTQGEEPRKQKPDVEIPLPPIPPEPKIERAAPVTAGEIEELLAVVLPEDPFLSSSHRSSPASDREIAIEIDIPDQRPEAGRARGFEVDGMVAMLTAEATGRYEFKYETPDLFVEIETAAATESARLDDERTAADLRRERRIRREQVQLEAGLAEIMQNRQARVRRERASSDRRRDAAFERQAARLADAVLTIAAEAQAALSGRRTEIRPEQDLNTLVDDAAVSTADRIHRERKAAQNRLNIRFDEDMVQLTTQIDAAAAEPVWTLYEDDSVNLSTVIEEMFATEAAQADAARRATDARRDAQSHREATQSLLQVDSVAATAEARVFAQQQTSDLRRNLQSDHERLRLERGIADFVKAEEDRAGEERREIRNRWKTSLELERARFDWIVKGLAAAEVDRAHEERRSAASRIEILFDHWRLSSDRSVAQIAANASVLAQAKQRDADLRRNEQFARKGTALGMELDHIADTEAARIAEGAEAYCCRLTAASVQGTVDLHIHIDAFVATETLRTRNERRAADERQKALFGQQRQALREEIDRIARREEARARDDEATAVVERNARFEQEHARRLESLRETASASAEQTALDIRMAREELARILEMAETTSDIAGLRAIVIGAEIGDAPLPLPSFVALTERPGFRNLRLPEYLELKRFRLRTHLQELIASRIATMEEEARRFRSAVATMPNRTIPDLETLRTFVPSEAVTDPALRAELIVQRKALVRSIRERIRRLKRSLDSAPTVEAVYTFLRRVYELRDPAARASLERKGEEKAAEFREQGERLREERVFAIDVEHHLLREPDISRDRRNLWSLIDHLRSLRAEVSLRISDPDRGARLRGAIDARIAELTARERAMDTSDNLARKLAAARARAEEEKEKERLADLEALLEVARLERIDRAFVDVGEGSAERKIIALKHLKPRDGNGNGHAGILPLEEMRRLMAGNGNGNGHRGNGNGHHTGNGDGHLDSTRHLLRAVINGEVSRRDRRNYDHAFLWLERAADWTISNIGSFGRVGILALVLTMISPAIKPLTPPPYMGSQMTAVQMEAEQRIAAVRPKFEEQVRNFAGVAAQHSFGNREVEAAAAEHNVDPRLVAAVMEHRGHGSASEVASGLRRQADLLSRYNNSDGLIPDLKVLSENSSQWLLRNAQEVPANPTNRYLQAYRNEYDWKVYPVWTRYIFVVNRYLGAQDDPSQFAQGPKVMERYFRYLDADVHMDDFTISRGLINWDSEMFRIFLRLLALFASLSFLYFTGRGLVKQLWTMAFKQRQGVEAPVPVNGHSRVRVFGIQPQTGNNGSNGKEAGLILEDQPQSGEEMLMGAFLVLVIILFGVGIFYWFYRNSTQSRSYAPALSTFLSIIFVLLTPYASRHSEDPGMAPGPLTAQGTGPALAAVRGPDLYSFYRRQGLRSISSLEREWILRTMLGQAGIRDLAELRQRWGLEPDGNFDQIDLTALVYEWLRANPARTAEMEDEMAFLNRFVEDAAPVEDTEKGGIHMVRSGETLALIAQRAYGHAYKDLYGHLTWEVLHDINRQVIGKNASGIRPKMKLSLPTDEDLRVHAWQMSGSKGEAPKAESAAEPQLKYLLMIDELRNHYISEALMNAPQGQMHIVQPKDVFVKVVSDHYGAAYATVYGQRIWEVVFALNKIENPRRIRPGDEIYLPPMPVVEVQAWEMNGGRGTVPALLEDAGGFIFDYTSVENRLGPEYRGVYWLRYGKFRIFPVVGRISSHFNPRRKHPILKVVRPHNGTDFAAWRGTPVRAVTDGKVVYAGWGPRRNERGLSERGLGKVVKIEHRSRDGRRYVTGYAHLSGINVRVGQELKEGDILGAVGSTGLSSGYHLHFVVWVDGQAMNPMGYFIDREDLLALKENEGSLASGGEALPVSGPEDSDGPARSDGKNEPLLAGLPLMVLMSVVSAAVRFFGGREQNRFLILNDEEERILLAQGIDDQAISEETKIPLNRVGSIIRSLGVKLNSIIGKKEQDIAALRLRVGELLISSEYNVVVLLRSVFTDHDFDYEEEEVIFSNATTMEEIAKELRKRKLAVETLMRHILTKVQRVSDIQVNSIGDVRAVIVKESRKRLSSLVVIPAAEPESRPEPADVPEAAPAEEVLTKAQRYDQALVLLIAAVEVHGHTKLAISERMRFSRPTLLKIFDEDPTVSEKVLQRALEDLPQFQTPSARLLEERAKAQREAGESRELEAMQTRVQTALRRAKEAGISISEMTRQLPVGRGTVEKLLAGGSVLSQTLEEVSDKIPAFEQFVEAEIEAKQRKEQQRTAREERKVTPKREGPSRAAPVPSFSAPVTVPASAELNAYRPDTLGGHLRLLLLEAQLSFQEVAIFRSEAIDPQDILEDPTVREQDVTLIQQVHSLMISIQAKIRTHFDEMVASFAEARAVMRLRAAERHLAVQSVAAAQDPSVTIELSSLEEVLILMNISDNVRKILLSPELAQKDIKMILNIPQEEIQETVRGILRKVKEFMGSSVDSLDEARVALMQIDAGRLSENLEKLRIVGRKIIMEVLPQLSLTEPEERVLLSRGVNVQEVSEETGIDVRQIEDVFIPGIVAKFNGKFDKMAATGLAGIVYSAFRIARYFIRKEDQYRPVVDQMASRIAEHRERSGERLFFVTVDGGSGTGKSTLTAYLVKRLKELGYPVLLGDDEERLGTDMLLKDSRWREAKEAEVIESGEEYVLEEEEFYRQGGYRRNGFRRVVEGIPGLYQALMDFVGSDEPEIALVIEEPYRRGVKAETGPASFTLTRDMIVVIEGKYAGRFPQAQLRFRVVNTKSGVRVIRRAEHGGAETVERRREALHMIMRPSFERFSSEVRPDHVVDVTGSHKYWRVVSHEEAAVEGLMATLEGGAALLLLKILSILGSKLPNRDEELNSMAADVFVTIWENERLMTLARKARLSIQEYLALDNQWRHEEIQEVFSALVKAALLKRIRSSDHYGLTQRAETILQEPLHLEEDRNVTALADSPYRMVEDKFMDPKDAEEILERFRRLPNSEEEQILLRMARESKAKFRKVSRYAALAMFHPDLEVRKMVVRINLVLGEFGGEDMDLDSETGMALSLVVQRILTWVVVSWTKDRPVKIPRGFRHLYPDVPLVEDDELQRTRKMARDLVEELLSTIKPEEQAYLLVDALRIIEAAIRNNQEAREGLAYLEDLRLRLIRASSLLERSDGLLIPGRDAVNGLPVEKAHDIATLVYRDGIRGSWEEAWEQQRQEAQSQQDDPGEVYSLLWEILLVIVVAMFLLREYLRHRTSLGKYVIGIVLLVGIWQVLPPVDRKGFFWGVGTYLVIWKLSRILSFLRERKRHRKMRDASLHQVGGAAVDSPEDGVLSVWAVATAVIFIAAGLMTRGYFNASGALSDTGRFRTRSQKLLQLAKELSQMPWGPPYFVASGSMMVPRISMPNIPPIASNLAAGVIRNIFEVIIAPQPINVMWENSLARYRLRPVFQNPASFTAVAVMALSSPVVWLSQWLQEGIGYESGVSAGQSEYNTGRIWRQAAANRSGHADGEEVVFNLGVAAAVALALLMLTYFINNRPVPTLVLADSQGGRRRSGDEDEASLLFHVPMAMAGRHSRGGKQSTHQIEISLVETFGEKLNRVHNASSLMSLIDGTDDIESLRLLLKAVEMKTQIGQWRPAGNVLPAIRNRITFRISLLEKAQVSVGRQEEIPPAPVGKDTPAEVGKAADPDERLKAVIEELMVLGDETDRLDEEALIARETRLEELRRDFGEDPEVREWFELAGAPLEDRRIALADATAAPVETEPEEVMPEEEAPAPAHEVEAAEEAAELIEEVTPPKKKDRPRPVRKAKAASAKTPVETAAAQPVRQEPVPEDSRPEDSNRTEEYVRAWARQNLQKKTTSTTAEFTDDEIAILLSMETDVAALAQETRILFRVVQTAITSIISKLRYYEFAVNTLEEAKETIFGKIDKRPDTAGPSAAIQPLIERVRGLATARLPVEVAEEHLERLIRKVAGPDFSPNDRVLFGKEVERTREALRKKKPEIPEEAAMPGVVITVISQARNAVYSRPLFENGRLVGGNFEGTAYLAPGQSKADQLSPKDVLADMEEFAIINIQLTRNGVFNFALTEFFRDPRLAGQKGLSAHFKAGALAAMYDAEGHQIYPVADETARNAIYSNPEFEKGRLVDGKFEGNTFVAGGSRIGKLNANDVLASFPNFAVANVELNGNGVFIFGNKHRFSRLELAGQGGFTAHFKDGEMVAMYDEAGNELYGESDRLRNSVYVQARIDQESGRRVGGIALGSFPAGIPGEIFEAHKDELLIIIENVLVPDMGLLAFASGSVPLAKIGKKYAGQKVTVVIARQKIYEVYSPSGALIYKRQKDFILKAYLKPVFENGKLIGWDGEVTYDNSTQLLAETEEFAITGVEIGKKGSFHFGKKAWFSKRELIGQTGLTAHFKDHELVAMYDKDSQEVYGYFDRFRNSVWVGGRIEGGERVGGRRISIYGAGGIPQKVSRKHRNVIIEVVFANDAAQVGFAGYNLVTLDEEYAGQKGFTLLIIEGRIHEVYDYDGNLVYDRSAQKVVRPSRVYRIYTGAEVENGRRKGGRLVKKVKGKISKKLWNKYPDAIIELDWQESQVPEYIQLFRHMIPVSEGLTTIVKKAGEIVSVWDTNGKRLYRIPGEGDRNSMYLGGEIVDGKPVGGEFIGAPKTIYLELLERHKGKRLIITQVQFNGQGGYMLAGQPIWQKMPGYEYAEGNTVAIEEGQLWPGRVYDRNGKPIYEAPGPGSQNAVFKGAVIENGRVSSGTFVDAFPGGVLKTFLMRHKNNDIVIVNVKFNANGGYFIGGKIIWNYLPGYEYAEGNTVLIPRGKIWPTEVFDKNGKVLYEDGVLKGHGPEDQNAIFVGGEIVDGKLSGGRFVGTAPTPPGLRYEQLAPYANERIIIINVEFNGEGGYSFSGTRLWRMYAGHENAKGNTVVLEPGQRQPDRIYAKDGTLIYDAERGPIDPQGRPVQQPKRVRKPRAKPAPRKEASLSDRNLVYSNPQFENGRLVSGKLEGSFYPAHPSVFENFGEFALANIEIDKNGVFKFINYYFRKTELSGQKGFVAHFRGQELIGMYDQDGKEVYGEEDREAAHRKEEQFKVYRGAEFQDGEIVGDSESETFSSISRDEWAGITDAVIVIAQVAARGAVNIGGEILTDNRRLGNATNVVVVKKGGKVIGIYHNGEIFFKEATPDDPNAVFIHARLIDGSVQGQFVDSPVVLFKRQLQAILKTHKVSAIWVTNFKFEGGGGLRFFVDYWVWRDREIIGI